MAEDLLNKYRPTKWENFVGHTKIVKSLSAAIKAKHSHAFLFTGASGLGKTTAARIAAAELGCSIPLEIDAATYTGIDDMRTVTDTLWYRLEEDVKVIIIDEVHALSKPAFQSLLKSLEEPPSWVFWFLCTTEPAKVPATVKTRCLHYDFKPIDYEDLYSFLDWVAIKEKIGSEFLSICVKEANGSPRQALANLAVCVSATSEEDAIELLHSAENLPEVVDLARALLNGKSWPEVQKLLAGLRDKDAEGVRRVVCAYMTSVILKVPKESVVGRAAEVLDVFEQPFYNSVGISSVARACAVLLLR